MTRAIEVKDLMNITVPRRNPWGESVSVNEAIHSVNHVTQEHLLTIEMQSGDLIKVEAGFISKA